MRELRADGATFEVEAVGRVASPLTDRATAPRQGDEGAPDATIFIDERLASALGGLEVGQSIFVLTWLDRADRHTLRVRPRGDPAAPILGVFATRSPDRPNPVGLHRVTIIDIVDTVITVSGLEALDGTPVLDIKPVLEPLDER